MSFLSVRFPSFYFLRDGRVSIMGVYDRDYYQGQPTGGFGGSSGRMLVTNLVIINFLIFLVEIIFDKNTSNMLDWFALEPIILVTNWKIWQLLSYGFLHSTQDIAHILFNMLALWVLGRDVEVVYGKQRFLSFYLSAIVISGLIGSYWEYYVMGSKGQLIGASGGVVAVVMLCILHFPRKTILLYFVLPIPLWVLGVGYLAYEFISAMKGGSGISHASHLVGAAFGAFYFKTGWDLGRLLPGKGALKRFKRRPNIRIHDPDADLSAEVDRVLEKISREGEDSLTKKERKTLERASQRYKQKNQ
ncbi:MAG: rhomboid family intramembrane serine protease [Planctomycetales bacterium]